MPTVDERWLPVVGYEGRYEVSDVGRVRSVTRVLRNGHRWAGRVLRIHKNPYGYPSIGLMMDGRQKTKNIHRMVLDAFVGPNPDMYCRHLDGNPENNKLENLKWGTQSQNSMDRVRHGTSNRGVNHGNSKLCDVDVWLIRECEGSQRRKAGFFGVSETTISEIISRKTWVHV